MIILLPPSEGKTQPDAGPALDLSALSLPELTDDRREILESLAAASARPDALTLLGVGAGLADDVERNTRLAEIPTAPALQTYTGVLYAALGAGRLTPTAQRRSADVWVSSALFGMLNAADPIPAYRLSMKTRLGDHGILSTWWRPRLAPVLDDAFAGRLVLDCRSSEYRKSWPGDPRSTVVVNVFHERDGRRTVVSHDAKRTRGELVGHLLRRRGELPEDVRGLLRAVRTRFSAEFTDAAGSRPAVLDIILRTSSEG